MYTYQRYLTKFTNNNGYQADRESFYMIQVMIPRMRCGTMTMIPQVGAPSVKASFQITLWDTITRLFPDPCPSRSPSLQRDPFPHSRQSESAARNRDTAAHLLLIHVYAITSLFFSRLQDSDPT